MTQRRLVFTAKWILLCYRDICDSIAHTKTHSEVVVIIKNMKQNEENGRKISLKDDLFPSCFSLEVLLEYHRALVLMLPVFLSIIGGHCRQPMNLGLEECYQAVLLFLRLQSMKKRLSEKHICCFLVRKMKLTCWLKNANFGKPQFLLLHFCEEVYFVN